MSENTVVHGTFTLEREYPVPPARAFAAWSDPAAKARWFAGEAEHELDFRVGGRETIRALINGAPVTVEFVYHDIVADRRIVWSSALSTGHTLATVAVTTVEFAETASGTRLTLTEQDTYLDGHELPEWRERGTADWLGKLDAELA